MDSRGCKSNVLQANVSVLNDTIFPVVQTKTATVYLINGTASLTASQVDSGSYDNCGVASVMVTPNVFANSDYGVKQVVVSVTDKSGNSTTRFATVNVESGVPVTCSLYLIRGIDPNTNGPLSTFYLGYGP